MPIELGYDTISILDMAGNIIETVKSSRGEMRFDINEPNIHTYIEELTGMSGWTKIKHSPVNVGKISGNTFSGSTITGTFTIGDPNDDTNEWAIPFDAPNVKYFCFHSKDSDINNNFKDRWVVIERSEMIRTSQLAGTYDYHSSYPHYYKTTYKPNGFVAKNSTYYTGGRRDQIIYNRNSSGVPDPIIATYYVKKDGSVIDPHTNNGDIATLFSSSGKYFLYREIETDTELLGIEQGVYVKYTDDTPLIHAIPLYTDTTQSLQSLAEFKTGVNGWRLVRFLPDGLASAFSSTDNLVGTDVYGDPTDFATEWSIEFQSGGYDQYLFVGGSFVDWLILNKTEFIPLDGSYNEVINAVKSSVNPNPHTVKAGTGTGGDRPLIALTEWEDGKHLYQESSSGTLQYGAGTYAERPYYIFVRSSTDTVSINPDPTHKILTFTYTPNDLIFTFRQDESPYSWQEAYDEAIANGKRMPTKTELLNYLASQGNQPLYQEDVWCPVVAPEYSNGKDWIHIGNYSGHFVGKSHTQYYGYPSWGDNTNQIYARIYCEVIENNQTEYTVNFPENTTCDILIVGGGGGGGTSYSSTSTVPGAGGGAGGVIFLQNQSIPAGDYTIKVGKGGEGDRYSDTSYQRGKNGFNSSFSYLQTEAIGGGGGGSITGTITGGSGGSGGGSVYAENNIHPEGGLGNTSDIVMSDGTIITSNYRQGYDGGDNKVNDTSYSGGGGGAGGAGKNSNDNPASLDGNGGVGRAGEDSIDFKTFFGIIDTSIGEHHSDGKVYFAGGGGNGYRNGDTNHSTGGLGGGGDSTMGNGENGKSNTGGGGSGSRAHETLGRWNGGNGGSGIVIIRYNLQYIQPPFDAQWTYSAVDTSVHHYGNVGIGTVASDTTQLTIGGDTNITGNYYKNEQILCDNPWYERYKNDNKDIYTISNNVGIGVLDPQYKLHVRGTLYANNGGFSGNGSTSWSTPCDMRIKENVVEASNEVCFENVKNINLYKFNYAAKYSKITKRTQYGFVAQEVQKYYPKAVQEKEIQVKDNLTINNLLTVDVTQLNYTLYGAIKHYVNEIDKIKSQLGIVDVVEEEPVAETTEEVVTEDKEELVTNIDIV